MSVGFVLALFEVENDLLGGPDTAVMRAAMAVAVVAAFTLSGCSYSSGVGTPGDFVHMSGGGPHYNQFGMASFTPHSWITSAGMVYYFDATVTRGTGNISFDGAHPGISAATAAVLMAGQNPYWEIWDYVLEDAFGARAAGMDMAKLRSLAPEFRNTATWHNQHPNLADGGVLTINVTFGGWNHVSRAYVGDGDEPYMNMRLAIEDAVTRVAPQA